MNRFSGPVPKLLACFLFILISGATAHAQFSALVWSDEFNYTGLPDPSKWTCEEGGHGWGNNELQYYTRDRAENARVENGFLIIEALKENFGSREYTSARLVTTGKGDWLYGRVEARAKVPGGRGTWPAIWMLPTDWAYGNWPASGEIDIMEHVGYDPTKIFGTAHTEAYNHRLGTQKGGSVTGNDWETAFHVYAIEWSPTTIDFYVDNQKYYTFINQGTWQTWPFDKRFHLVMNLAVGGSWGGAQGVDPTVFPKRLEIDYVRVYQSAELKITGPAYLDPGQSASYAATVFPGGIYEWQVPADAEITAGAGTSEITVRWGHTDGEVSLKVINGPTMVTTANFIKTAVVPAENTFWFGNLVDGNTADLIPNCSDGSTFLFTESGESVKIVYNTVTPTSWPRFELTLPRPVNLKSHPYCVINLKTFNKSNSVTLRFDFADVNGMETNATPVFRPWPILSDGLYHPYQNNFTGRWTSSSPSVGKVDSTRIIRLIAYVNAGLFGQPNKSDSLWIESIKFLTSPLTGIDEIPTPETTISIWPNPVRDQLNILSSEIMDEIEIIDIRGTRVRKISGHQQSTLHIPLGNLPSGLYFVRSRMAGGEVFTNKFVKN